MREARGQREAFRPAVEPPARLPSSRERRPTRAMVAGTAATIERLDAQAERDRVWAERRRAALPPPVDLGEPRRRRR